MMKQEVGFLSVREWCDNMRARILQARRLRESRNFRMMHTRRVCSWREVL
jgi:hypothetical protein